MLLLLPLAAAWIEYLLVGLPYYSGARHRSYLWLRRFCADGRLYAALCLSWKCSRPQGTGRRAIAVPDRRTDGTSQGEPPAGSCDDPDRVVVNNLSA